MPTTVAHCHGDRSSHGNIVYCGRPSKWGNPFVVGRDGTREQVVAKHARWLAEESQEGLLASITDLRGKVLTCFCSPRACHCDTLAKVADLEPFTIDSARALLQQIAGKQ